MDGPDPGARIVRVDQLRGIAALAVVVCHFSVSAYVAAPNAGQPRWPWLATALGLGYLGVPLFFVVSGFCIHWPQARAAHVATRVAPDWAAFFRRRLLRLYPPYLLSLLATLVLLALTTRAAPLSAGDLLLQIGLVHTLHPRTFLGLNPPTWTLAVEAQLYLAYPLVFVLTRRLGPWRALAAILAVTMTYRLAIAFAPIPKPYGGVVWELFLARWFEWTCGALVAEWAAGNLVLPRLSGSPLLVAPALAAAVFVGEWHFWHYGIYVLREPLYGIAFALLLVMALELRPMRSTSRLGAWIAAVGVCSYSVYLVHRPIQLAFEPLARRLAATPLVVRHALPSSLLLLSATTPLVLWAARLFYRCCEEPFVRAARRAGRPPAAAEPVVAVLPPL